MKNELTVTRISVPSEKLTRALTLVQVSDLHNARYGDRQERLIEAIRRERPDFVAVTGDLFNRKDVSAFQNAFDLIERLTALFPVYAVEGNHEARLNEWGERLLKGVAERGAILLRNDRTHAYGVNIIGLKQRADGETLHRMLDPDRFNLILCHRPELFPQYWDSGADLILCGHAHGGQVRIGGRGVLAPNQGLFPKYTAGLYTHGATRMFVSRGLGDTIRIPRIRNPHELCVIRLEPKNR